MRPFMNGTRAKNSSSHIANELNKYGSSGNHSKLTLKTRKFESRGGNTGNKGQARSSSVIVNSHGSSRKPVTLDYDESDDDDDDNNDENLSETSDDNF